MRSEDGRRVWRYCLVVVETVESLCRDYQEGRWRALSPRRQHPTYKSLPDPSLMLEPPTGHPPEPSCQPAREHHNQPREQAMQQLTWHAHCSPRTQTNQLITPGEICRHSLQSRLTSRSVKNFSPNPPAFVRRPGGLVWREF